MFVVEIYAAVRRFVFMEGHSRREAARVFGLSRDTIAKMCRYSAPPGYVRTRPPEKPKLGPLLPVIEAILEADRSAPPKQQHTAKRVFERLRDEHGYGGGYTVVKDQVRRLRARGREVFVPLSHPPGHAQVDFGEAVAVIGGVRQKVHYFCLDLPQSDACFVKAYTVPMSGAAEALHERKLAEEDTWARRVAGTPQAAIVNRLGENASKLALIAAISSNPAHPAITEHETDWGWALAEHCARTVLRDAERFIADSEFEKRLNKAIAIISKHGPCSRRELFHKGLKLTAREFGEVIDALVSNGVVMEAALEAHSGAGRPPGTRYALAPPPCEAFDEEEIDG